MYGLVTNKPNENKKTFSHPNLINIGRYFLLYLFISRTSRVVTTDKHISDRHPKQISFRMVQPARFIANGHVSFVGLMKWGSKFGLGHKDSYANVRAKQKRVTWERGVNSWLLSRLKGVDRRSGESCEVGMDLVTCHIPGE